MRTKPKRRRSSSKKEPEPMLVAPARDERQRAKVFWTGRSQAIRLPKEFRFNVDAVFIHREGNKVVLEPDGGWPEGYFEWLLTGPLPDFEAPSRKGPARSKDPFQEPPAIGSGRTIDMFDPPKRRDKRKRSARNRERQ